MSKKRPRQKRPELPDAASPWALLQAARAAVGLRSIRAAECELLRLLDAGLISRPEYDAGMRFLRLRRAVLGFEQPASPITRYSARTRSDDALARVEQDYRRAVRAVGSPHRLAALQRALIDLDGHASGQPLSLPDVLAVRAALSSLAQHFARQ